MSPDAAYEYVKSIRPRVLLASAQWQVSVKLVCVFFFVDITAPVYLSYFIKFVAGNEQNLSTTPSVPE